MEVYTGITKSGKGRGTTLGFPTANIPLEDNSVSGIYAARVKVDGAEYLAAAFADQKRKVLEAHLLDYSGELSASAKGGPASGGKGNRGSPAGGGRSASGGNGKSITIELCKKIREHADFADDKDLREAIATDIVRVREYFAEKL